MKRLLGSVCAWVLSAAAALSATLLPQGRQTFFDSQGQPLVGGLVYFYQLGSQTTPKTTWKDSGQTQPNTNPIQLDGAGSATIYGSGTYQQVVVDINGNVVWNQPTADTSYVSNTWLWGGISTGSPNAQTITLTNFSAATGQLVSFIAALTNNSALTVNGYNVVKDSPSGPSNLSGGEVVVGNSVSMVFDPVLQQFHMVEPATYPPLWGGQIGAVASGATADICLNQPMAMINITGSLNIASLGSSCNVGQMKMVYFQNSLTLINSGNLLLPNGSNFVAPAGSWAIFGYTATNVWRMIYPNPTIYTAPSVTVYTSGSGTYTTPAGALYLEVEMCGGGGGGGGSGTGTTGGAGGAGSATTFGSLTANGGAASPVANVGPASTAATASGGDINVSGTVGGPGNTAASSGFLAIGGTGGGSPFGSGGAGGGLSGINGNAATAPCAGGGGAATTTVNTNNAWGGNAGAYLRKLIASPSATYSYGVGTAGAGGAAGTSGSAGSAGAAGVIIVKARFQ